jgi:hypothetical protein
MGATSHRGFPYPEASDPMKPRVDIKTLADDLDAKSPKITYGTGAAPTTNVRDGDIHLQYV